MVSGLDYGPGEREPKDYGYFRENGLVRCWRCLKAIDLASGPFGQFYIGHLANCSEETALLLKEARITHCNYLLNVLVNFGTGLAFGR